MKSYQVRAVAVIAVVLVALTGARKSDGGGCDTGEGRAASGGGIGGGDGNHDRAAASDISVTRCALDATQDVLVAELRMENGAQSPTTYRATVEFQDRAFTVLDTAYVTNVQVPARQTRTTVVRTAYTGEDPGRVRCVVLDVDAD